MGCCCCDPETEEEYDEDDTDWMCICPDQGWTGWYNPNCPRCFPE